MAIQGLDRSEAPSAGGGGSAFGRRRNGRAGALRGCWKGPYQQAESLFSRYNKGSMESVHEGFKQAQRTALVEELRGDGGLENKPLAWLLERAAADIESRPWELNPEWRETVRLATGGLVRRVGVERAKRLMALVRLAMRCEAPANADETEWLVALATVADPASQRMVDDDALRREGAYADLAHRELARLAEGVHSGFRSLVHAAETAYQRGSWTLDSRGFANPIRWEPVEPPPSWDELETALADMRSKRAVERAEGAERWARTLDAEAKLLARKTAKAAKKQAEAEARAAEAWEQAKAVALPTVASAVAKGARKAAKAAGIGA